MPDRPPDWQKRHLGGDHGPANLPEPQAVRRLLSALKLGAKKRWGQNFLANPDTAQRIVDLAELLPEHTVWEIGPGLGILTERLLKTGARVIAFEIDWGLVNFLTDRFGRESFEILPGDAVKGLSQARGEYGIPERLVSNLPYRSAAAILGRMVEMALWIPLQVITVQKEVADRMAAEPGSKDYSSFSVLIQSAYEVRSELQLPPGVFYPVPEVDSRVLRLRLREGAPADPEALSRLCRASFASRRKTLRNNLRAAGYRGREATLKPGTTGTTGGLEEALGTLDIDPETRAERLTVDQFVRLAECLTTAPVG